MYQVCPTVKGILAKCSELGDVATKLFILSYSIISWREYRGIYLCNVVVPSHQLSWYSSVGTCMEG